MGPEIARDNSLLLHIQAIYVSRRQYSLYVSYVLKLCRKNEGARKIFFKKHKAMAIICNILNYYTGNGLKIDIYLFNSHFAVFQSLEEGHRIELIPESSRINQDKRYATFLIYLHEYTALLPHATLLEICS
jgi:hypothetical protein